MTDTKPPNAVLALIAGRSNRREYWLSMFGLVIVNIVLSVLLPPVVASAVSLPLWIVIGARRLHDFSRTGWWSLLPVGVGFLVGFLIGIGVPIPDTAALVVNGAVTIITAIVVGSIAGSKGANRFGPSPNTESKSVSAVFD